ncbi:MAG: UDP-N-acetylmuramoyl-tripeptide--D-alanyl-D-alanine ligase [Gammaproteobacteria bacterium]
MSMGTLAMVATEVGGQLIGADRAFESVSTDTRSLSPGQLFFALRGEQYDATQFVAEAQSRGAAGVVVEQQCDCELPQVQVPDTRQALGIFARAWRNGFKLPVIAVTGSNGKTTVKEMIAAIMRAEHADADDSILATQGNLNNDIGLPLTVLELREHHRAAVLEMGANHPGEIAALAKIAAPEIGVITNAAPAHLEGFGSIADVAATKGELLDELPESGTAVLNCDDTFFDYWDERRQSRNRSSFGLAATADYRAENISEHMEAGEPTLKFTLHYPGGEIDLCIGIAGRHNVENVLAAAAAAQSAGASIGAIADGLKAVVNVAGRLRPLKVGSGITIYDDSYNANPASVGAAIAFLAGMASPRWLVLGDMGELGDTGEALHREIGTAASEVGIDRLFCVGALSKATAEAFGPDAEWHETLDDLWASLQKQLPAHLSILIKGSRFMGLDRLVADVVAFGRQAESEG